MTQVHLATIIKFNTNAPTWAFWAILILFLILLVILYFWIRSSAEDDGIEIGKERTIGKLYVLTKADVGKIYLPQWVLYTNNDDSKIGNIGVAFMREDGRDKPRWYQLPSNHEGKPVRPEVGQRCRLAKGEKAEYCHFERENNL